ncbi:MAG: DUF697 domain-containing protein [Desulfovibrionaceae bacterium]|nr:DUF697 domain-containing protein [Desulfovibrionaceae bacterium]
MSQTEHNEQITPALLVCGAEGAGKRSLVQALLKATILPLPSPEEGITHTIDIKPDGIPVTLVTANEENVDETLSTLSTLLPWTTILLWLVRYDKKSLESDIATLRKLRAKAPELPIIILGTGIDRSTTFFNPATFSLASPKSDAEKAVCEWMDHLTKDFAEALPNAVLPCAVGTGPNDISRQFNLPKISDTIENLLPQAMRMQWIAFEKANKDTGVKAEKMIVAATTAAGTVGLLPLPIADMPFIVAIQVALIISLCSLYGKAFTADAARSLVLAALSALAGPIAFQNIIKFVPGFGSVVGGGVAAACTYAVGKGTKLLLERNEPFTLSAFTKTVKEFFSEYRKKKKDPEISKK